MVPARLAHDGHAVVRSAPHRDCARTAGQFPDLILCHREAGMRLCSHARQVPGPKTWDLFSASGYCTRRPVPGRRSLSSSGGIRTAWFGQFGMGRRSRRKPHQPTTMVGTSGASEGALSQDERRPDPVSIRVFEQPCSNPPAWRQTLYLDLPRKTMIDCRPTSSTERNVPHNTVLY